MLVVFLLIFIIKSSVGMQSVGEFSLVLSFLAWSPLLAIGLPYVLRNNLAAQSPKNLFNEKFSSCLDQVIAFSQLFLILILLLGLFLVFSVYSGPVFVLGSLFASPINSSSAIIALLVFPFSEFFIGFLLSLGLRNHASLINFLFSAFMIGVGLVSCLRSDTNSSISLFFAAFILSSLSSYIIFSLALIRVYGLNPLDPAIIQLLFLDKTLFLDSLGYWLFGLLAVVALRSDYILASRALSAASLGTYSIIQKLIDAPLTILGFYLVGKYPFFSSCFAQKRQDEILKLIRRIYKSYLIQLPVVLICIALVYFFYLRTAFDGKGMEIALLAFTAFIYFLIRLLVDPLSSVLFATNRVSIMNKFLPFQSFLSIALIPVFASLFDISGIFMAQSASFILTAAWIVPVAVLRYS